jgi:hypothetical protein
MSSASLVGKQLELFRDAIPSLSRVAADLDSSIDTQHEPYEVAARNLGIDLTIIGVSGRNELESAFATAAREGVGGLIVSGGPFIQQLGGETRTARFSARSDSGGHRNIAGSITE